MTPTCYRGRALVVFVTFTVLTLPCFPVAFWCTRNNNDILPQLLGGVRHLFPSRHYSNVRFTGLAAREAGQRHPHSGNVKYSTVGSVRLGARNDDDNDILRRSCGGGVRHLFPSRHNYTVRSRLARERRQRHSIVDARVVGVHILFFSSSTTPGLSGRVRIANDDNNILPQLLGGESWKLLPSRHYSAVRSCLGASER
ncbi:hypothetical protein TNCV_3023111 [Trichonephila clavipes]|nr:hypothetical protein TNCV_3023111 [Trichonephila clavipes]